MTEAYFLLKVHGARLKQIHLSEVSTQSKHCALSRSSILAFQEVAHLIPAPMPIILESVVDEKEVADEILRAHAALTPASTSPTPFAPEARL